MSGYEARCRDIREGLLRYFIDCDTRPGQGWGWRPDAAMCDIPREMHQPAPQTKVREDLRITEKSPTSAFARPL